VSKKLRQKKLSARKVAVKEKVAKRREKIRAEAKVAKLIAQLRKEMGDVIEPRSADTTTEGDLLGGSRSPTENRTDV
jgi:hypothetical protein